MPGGVKKLFVILGCQVWSEKADRRQCHGAISEQIEDVWEPSRGARGLDPPVGGVLGQMQTLRAVREQRRVAFTKVQTACVELGKRRDQARRRFTFAPGERLDFPKKLFITEVRRLAKVVVHASVVASQFLPLENRDRGDFHRRSRVAPSIRTNSHPGSHWS